MKILALFTLVTMLTSLNERKTKEMYYFCISHSMNTGVVQGKENVLLTTVKSLVAEEEYAKTLSKAWRNIVSKECSNADGCTSDFNYYIDEASASKQFEAAKAKYGDTSRYQIKIIDFKAKLLLNPKTQVLIQTGVQKWYISKEKIKNQLPLNSIKKAT
jgi:hypothetical protein